MGSQNTWKSSPITGMLALNSLVPIYTPEWREALREESVFFKNTTHTSPARPQTWTAYFMPFDVHLKKPDEISLKSSSLQQFQFNNSLLQLLQEKKTLLTLCTEYY